MPMSSTELAKETGAHAPSLHRLLRGLTGLGVVEQRDRDLFSLTAEGAACAPTPRIRSGR